MLKKIIKNIRLPRIWVPKKIKAYAIYKRCVIYKNLLDDNSGVETPIKVAEFRYKYQAKKCIQILKSLGIKEGLEIKAIEEGDKLVAEEMFNKLGYTKDMDSSKIKYRHLDYLGTIYKDDSIEFNLAYKKVSLSNKGFNGSNNLDKTFNLSLELLTAINKQIEELGWKN